MNPMAMMQVNFYSKALRREVIFNALLPLEDRELPEQPRVENRSMKALYLVKRILKHLFLN